MNSIFLKRQHMLENRDSNAFDNPENYDVFLDVKSTETKSPSRTRPEISNMKPVEDQHTAVISITHRIAYPPVDYR